MKTHFSLRAGLGFMLATTLATGSAVFAAATPAVVGDVSPSVDSAVAIAAYPLTTCAVSGDKLEDGDMGPPINYVYKQEGQPDRLVRLCCKGCIKKLKSEPTKYLKMIDDAAAAKAGGAAPVAGDAHTGHSH